jgi:hypothetical protein
MLRERLRIASGMLRWSYLHLGAVGAKVERRWNRTRRLVEREVGWPVGSGLQEFAYFALNASFIDLAWRGRKGKWRTYYDAARRYRESAGDKWFRLRLDQMAVLSDSLGPEADRRRQGGLTELASIAVEMRGMEDWTGIAFCAYQGVVLRDGRVNVAAIKELYDEWVKGSDDDGKEKPPPFESRTDRERLFKILCDNDEKKKERHFPAWANKPMPMPLNLHGLLMLRTVSLLDQANWTPDRA